MNSSKFIGRLSSADGRRNPCSTSVRLRAWSPLNMPRICDSETCDSSMIVRNSGGKKSISVSGRARAPGR
jgi:hypothetical protein